MLGACDPLYNRVCACVSRMLVIPDRFRLCVQRLTSFLTATWVKRGQEESPKGLLTLGGKLVVDCGIGQKGLKTHTPSVRGWGIHVFFMTWAESGKDMIEDKTETKNKKTVIFPLSLLFFKAACTLARVHACVRVHVWCDKQYGFRSQGRCRFKHQRDSFSYWGPGSYQTLLGRSCQKGVRVQGPEPQGSPCVNTTVTWHYTMTPWHVSLVILYCLSIFAISVSLSHRNPVRICVGRVEFLKNLVDKSSYSELSNSSRESPASFRMPSASLPV